MDNLLIIVDWFVGFLACFWLWSITCEILEKREEYYQELSNYSKIDWMRGKYFWIRIYLDTIIFIVVWFVIIQGFANMFIK